MINKGKKLEADLGKSAVFTDLLLDLTCALTLILLTTLAVGAEEFTRGVGVFPGRVSESGSPVLVSGTSIHRNLALHRPVDQSSAYDYNLTAQLVTDGIITREEPPWISLSTSEQKTVEKQRRERLFDGNWVTVMDLTGSAILPHGSPPPWVRLDLGGSLPEVDALELRGQVKAGGSGPENWTCLVWGSDDGLNWRRLGFAEGMTHAVGEFRARIPLAATVRCRAYRLDLIDPRARVWTLQEWRFFNRDSPVRLGGPHRFGSAWKSAGSGEEWLKVDLGALSRIDRLVMDWIARPLAGEVQISRDGQSWKTLVALPSTGYRDDLPFSQRQARYLKILMTKARSPQGYVLSELAVWGRGGLVPQAKPQLEADVMGEWELTRGNWRLQRASQVTAEGLELSDPAYADQTWLPATVPGTVLASYLNAGAVADPDFGDQQNLISDAFFYSDFWYRNTFRPPPLLAGERQWLCFDGVNWKAEVFLNGQRLGRIEGAFARERFDVTRLLRPGQANALAVRVEKNAHPGSVKEKTFESPGENGGELGRDNPTFHPSIGWDWIPTIRGRNTGIWDRVRLITRGPVTLERPLVKTTLPLPDISKADVTLSVTLRHHGDQMLRGRLIGNLGDISFEQAVELAPGELRSLHFDPASHPALRVQNPRLWWPNGYGEAHLYPVDMHFLLEGSDKPSDRCSFFVGLRQVSSSPDGESLRLWINGRRFVPKGGNWGFSESMLRYRTREFDAALRYHRDMNFNMVRNWLGMVGQDAFYEACDRYGIMVWQDFWLANPWDGDDPDDAALFLANAEMLVHRIRTHPCLGIYCGRNEGYPPWSIETALRNLLKQAHGDLVFVPSSADGVVGGYGPYQVKPLASYGTEFAKNRLHSEMGMPNIPTLDSLRQMIPMSELWPIGRLWGIHDFCLNGAQGGKSFLETLQEAYGVALNLEEWNAQAQFLNYDGYRAMFEGQNLNRQGLLIWMSHPAWPSMVWQTYDWYLEPSAAYFGAKKACEPLHIQWHEASDHVMVINTSAGDQRGLTARAQLFNLGGALVWDQVKKIDSPEDSLQKLFSIERPRGLDPVYLLRLSLEQDGRVWSENDYLRGRPLTETRQVKRPPAARVEMEQTARRKDGEWTIRAELRNISTTTALQLRLLARQRVSGKRILPVLYSDNYVHLLPGEKRVFTVLLNHEDTGGEEPVLSLQGFNL